MGMPLYGLKKDIDEKKKENEKEEDRSGLEDFGDIPDRSSRNGMYGDFGSPRSRTWRR